ncbi:hypothetical protein JCM10212_005114 [Sporobolomyces blumeae]
MSGPRPDERGSDLADATGPAVLDSLLASLSLSNSAQTPASATPGGTSTDTSRFSDANNPASAYDKLDAEASKASPTSSSAHPRRRSTPRPFVLLQPACTKHRYIRNHHDISEIVERPERIKAVKAGVAASWSRIEQERIRGQASSSERWRIPSRQGSLIQDDELGDLMGSLSLDSQTSSATNRTGEVRTTGEADSSSIPFDILVSKARMLVDDAALRMIHGVPNEPPLEEAVHSAQDADVLSEPLAASKPDPTPLDRSTSTPTRRSSPRKPASAPVPATFPPDLPWPSQLQHLIDRVPPLASTSAPYTARSTASARRESEIPAHLPQGDLYLCRESDEAIFGALGTVCEAVDRVIEGTKLSRDDIDAPADDGKGKEAEVRYDRGFVVIRPPGHHCGEASPQGFCFVNNVCVAAAHAHVKHGINRVVILDIDLHHGNGTQDIVWRLNAQANDVLTKHREAVELRSSPRKSPKKGGQGLGDRPKSEEPKVLQVMYGSLHDILSFPCESGDPALISAASLNISGGHSQYISNVHLEPYSTEDDFQARLWETYWRGLGGKAEEFLEKTFAQDDETLVIVSAGFDASTHEYPSMSRHHRHVPTWFYQEFARSIRRFSDRHARGRLLFVLEGGYSDRALLSGTAGILEGLVGDSTGSEWTESDLGKVEKLCGLRLVKGKKPGTTGGIRRGVDEPEDWVKRTQELFEWIEPPMLPSPATAKARTTGGTVGSADPPSSGSRQLRERKLRVDYAGLADMVPSSGSSSRVNTPTGSPQVDPDSKRGGAGRRTVSGPAFASKNADDKASSDQAPLPPPIPALPVLPGLSVVAQPAPTRVEPGSTPSAASAEPSTTAHPTATTKPAVKFVWKQGGIGGSGFQGGGEPRM